jgi:hypothetical protein
MTLSKKMIPYLLICGISYYLLPLLGKDTGTFMLILLILLPLITLVTSSIYGLKNGWNFLFPVLIGLIFLPGIFIYYNSSAMIYVPGYAFISLVGMMLGKAFKNSHHS